MKQTSFDLAAEPSNGLPYVPASRPRSADIVVYVDLDGVLQHHAVLFHPKKGAYMSPSVASDRTLFEWTSILIKVLSPFPDVRLVLSSSWCVRPGYRKTLLRLPAELRWRFIGGTFHKKIHGADPWTKESFLRTPRGEQVMADAKRRKPLHWRALDDDIEDWPVEALQNLIACDGRVGISDVRVQEALQAWLLQVSPET